MVFGSALQASASLALDGYATERTYRLSVPPSLETMYPQKVGYRTRNVKSSVVVTIRISTEVMALPRRDWQCVRPVRDDALVDCIASH